MWIVLIAANVAPLWPVFRRYSHHVSTFIRQGSSPVDSIPLEDHPSGPWKPNRRVIHKNDTTLLQSEDSTDNKILMTGNFGLHGEPVKGLGGSSHEDSHKPGAG